MANRMAVFLGGKCKKIFFQLFLVVVLANGSFASTIQLPQTGQMQCYDASGIEITCPGTGQDGETQKGVAWPNPRFADNGDGTITDTLTGLMWLQDANCAKTAGYNPDQTYDGQMTWQHTLDFIAGINSNTIDISTCGSANYSDWRLPNVVELLSLVDHGSNNSAISEVVNFKNIRYWWYSSSTTVSYYQSPNSMWVVDFADGGIGASGKTNAGFFAWPVRSNNIGVIQLPSTGQFISYAPGDDGDLQIGVPWISPRFTEHANGTVDDNFTNLMWTKNAAMSNSSWQDALDYVKQMNNGIHENFGYTDWRLPNINELRSLMDLSNGFPALPEGHPFTNIQNTHHWSSTTLLSNGTSAWGVSFWYGEKFPEAKNYANLVWPVRDGGGTPSITAPLHGEEGLHMTTSDYSNFATREYFNVLKINHSGVDLALSTNGTATASQVTANKTARAICDGDVDFVHKNGGLYSFVKINHPDCNGQDIIAYYGHISPNKDLTTVKADDPIGTVKDWDGNSHLHLTIDTQIERDLSHINYVTCDYTLDSNQSVTSLTNCSSNQEVTNGKMLLKIGWGQIKTIKYKNNKGRLYQKNLYITEGAVRQLGFISFFDLYQE